MASRSRLFQVHSILSPISFSLSFLVLFLRGRHFARAKLLQINFGSHVNELQASSWSEHEGAWLVAGSPTREVFPADGPAHKYAALFHRDPAFDALRFAFMVQADVDMTPVAFTERLLHVVADADAAHLTDTFMAALTQLSDTVREFTCVESSNFPMDFADRAWPAYLGAIMSSEYYFSAEELIVLADVADVSLVVLQARAGEYHVGGGSRCSADEVVFVKIEDNGRERVRGHFERCFRTAALQELEASLTESTVPAADSAAAAADSPGRNKDKDDRSNDGAEDEAPQGSRARSSADEPTAEGEDQADHLQTPLAACATANQETIMHAGNFSM